MSAEYGSSGPAGLVVVGDHAKMMEAVKTNPYLAKLMPKMPASDGNKQTYEGSFEPENKAEMYEDWKQALEFEGERNDKEDGSGVLFNIVVIGDRKTGPPQEGIPVEARPESTSTTGLESALEELWKEVPARTLTGDNEKDFTKSAAKTTAEILKEAVDADMLPSDSLTREHFGFNRASTVREESNLLGLYQGLLIHLPNPPSTRTVQGWLERNKIAGGIYHAYKSQHGRSEYFNWFKKNQHIVDPKKDNMHSQIGHP